MAEAVSNELLLFCYVTSLNESGSRREGVEQRIRRAGR